MELVTINRSSETFGTNISRSAREASLARTSEWFAVYTRHRHEKAVAHHLDMLGFEVFLPLRFDAHQWTDRRKIIAMPLFPSYVFLSGDLKRRFDILNVPGVCLLVCSDGKPAKIPESELNAVRRIVNSLVLVEPHPFLRCGERVRVHTGPLTGIEGIVIRKKDSLRLVLSVEMLGRSVAVDVDEAHVEPVRYI